MSKAAVAERQMRRAPIKRKSIPFSLRFEIWAMPCVICGDTGDIEIDHIIPIARGCGNERENLQPLCHQCHARKGALVGRSNEALREIYLKNSERHHLVNKYRLATRHINPFDRPSFESWRAAGEQLAQGFAARDL